MFSNDECTGCGVWENEKLRYDGYFKNGKRDGEGVEIFYPEKYNMKNPPLKFVGHFKEGERDGLGVKEFKNGLKYDGNFVKGKREGQGKLVWPKEDRNGEINIKVFSGNFKNDKPAEGKGSLIWGPETNYNSYDGEFKNGKFNGKGKLKKNDGEEYDGNFEDGIYHGFGKLKKKMENYITVISIKKYMMAKVN